MLSGHVTLQRRQHISMVALCTGFLHKKGSCRPLKNVACRKRPVLMLVQLKIWFAPWQQDPQRSQDSTDRQKVAILDIWNKPYLNVTLMKPSCQQKTTSNALQIQHLFNKPLLKIVLSVKDKEKSHISWPGNNLWDVTESMGTCLIF